MFDSHRRNIDYARISITDRCNLRCVYCMPEEGVVKQRHDDILSYGDIVRVCRALVSVGVRKFRLTGGEPLVRLGVRDLAASIKALPGVESLNLTTNGQLLAGMAADLRAAGIDGVNVSLDALDPELYRSLTRGGDVAAALRGIDAALDAGFPAVKINCVPFAGKSEGEIVRVAGLARERKLHVRFIQAMPLGAGAAFRPVAGERLRAALEDAYGKLEPAGGPGGSGPARYYSLPGFRGCVGFIETLGHDICGGCNRLRLTADGVLKTCLHMDAGTSLKPALAGGDDDAIAREIARAVARKPPHHQFASLPGERRFMSQIGG